MHPSRQPFRLSSFEHSRGSVVFSDKGNHHDSESQIRLTRLWRRYGEPKRERLSADHEARRSSRAFLLPACAS
jgi:hypothetical protein